MQNYREFVSELRDFLPTVVKQLENLMDEDLVLFIGSTGSGKSTFICYLLGGEFRLVKIDLTRKKLTRVDSATFCPEIGDNPIESKTFCPQSFSFVRHSRI